MATIKYPPYLAVCTEGQPMTLFDAHLPKTEQDLFVCFHRLESLKVYLIEV